MGLRNTLTFAAEDPKDHRSSRARTVPAAAGRYRSDSPPRDGTPNHSYATPPPAASRREPARRDWTYWCRRGVPHCAPAGPDPSPAERPGGARLRIVGWYWSGDAKSTGIGFLCAVRAGFEVEEQLFGVGAAGVAAGAAVGTDDPVAGQQETDRVAAECSADGSAGAR